MTGHGGVLRRPAVVLAVTALVLAVVTGSSSATGRQVPDAAPSAGPAQAAPGPDAVRPLVIVLDTSGSMSDDDGTGTIKLAGAQAALSNVIRQQRPGSQIGLWSYPSDSSCEPGRFQIPVKDLEQRSMIRAIRRLEANGETPTGEALRAVVDDLTANGYAGATILLISDGLSNCGADPCQVAQEISAEGFDLTVNTAGFQISSEGQDELDCIASATGGSTYEATDSTELGETIADATRAELALDIEGIPTEIPAGSATRVKVTVTNSSAVDVEDARISFTFGVTGEQQSIIPAVLPPLVRLGNLPAGAVTEHSWVVSYGSQGKIGSTEYRVAAWGANAQPREVKGVVRVTDSDLGWDEADGAIADLEGERIAILGDSYSSGEGAGDYLDGTDQNTRSGDNQCHKSPHTYLYPLFDGSDVELIACSGATTHRIEDGPSTVQEEQVPVLRDVQDDHGPVAAAFMTIGGNDIEFGSMVKSCLKAGSCSEDQELTDRVERLLRGLQPDLEETYEDVYQALNEADAVEERGGELAPLYILPYPQPFPEPQWASWCRGFDGAEIAWANDLVDDLDAVIEEAVRAVRDQGYRVHLISTVQEAFLPDNTACPRPGAEEYMNSVDLITGGGSAIGDWFAGTSNTNEFMHPNAKGYRAETNVVLAWSVNTPEELPDGVREWRPPPERPLLQGLLDGLGDFLTPTLPTTSRAVFDAREGAFTSEPIDVRAGQSFEIEVVNAVPGSRVVVMIESRAQRIGGLTVGDDGTGRAAVEVPERLPSGGHQLTTIALSEDGAMTVGSQGVDVSRSIPPWFLPLAVGTLLAFLAAAVLARRHRRTMPAAGEPLTEEDDRP